MITHNTLLDFDGTEQSIAEHALDYGIPASRIIMRLNAGWSTENAITRPVSVETGIEPRKRSLPEAQPKRPSHARTFTYSGRTLSLKEWSVVTGISPMTLQTRLQRGMTFREAITTPVLQRKART